jgi:hypothetical protein
MSEQSEHGFSRTVRQYFIGFAYLACASLTAIHHALRKKKQEQKEFKPVGFADLNDTSSLKMGEKKPHLSVRS